METFRERKKAGAAPEGTAPAVTKTKEPIGLRLPGLLENLPCVETWWARGGLQESPGRMPGDAALRVVRWPDTKLPAGLSYGGATSPPRSPYDVSIMDRIDRRQIVTAAAVAALVTQVGPPGTTAGQESGGDGPPPPADRIAALNAEFRGLYAANRDELVTAVPLAAATLIGTAEIGRIEHGRITHIYPAATVWVARAKGLLHGLIALQATGARLVRGADATAARQDATRLASLLKESTRLATGLPDAMNAAAGRVLAAAATLSRRWADEGRAAPGDTRETLAPLQGDLESILDQTGAAVFADVVAGLRAFRDDRRPEDWDSCLVLVCGPPFARRDSIEIAAGMEVLGRDALGKRLLYIDNVFTLDDAARQAAGCAADRDLGADVFGDPLRMWRDLLGDTARRRAGGGFFPFMGVD